MHELIYFNFMLLTQFVSGGSTLSNSALSKIFRFRMNQLCSEIALNWQTKWREYVRTLLELRQRPDLLDPFNEGRRGLPPVSILSPECILQDR
jgi:hypothetical protein